MPDSVLNFFMRSSFRMAGSQELCPDNNSANLDEGLMASVKDPLWFLSRQWQMGEFEAESGGSPASISLDYASTAPDTLTDDDGVSIALAATPWERQVEAEDNEGSAFWDSERLEYRFAVSNDKLVLGCEEYRARRFDWFSFDIEQIADWTSGETTQKRFAPAMLSFKGMPHARWWKFESGATFLESGYHPEPNALSMILAEYAIADANNWFLCPLTLDVGAVHAITGLRVVDNFGVSSDLTNMNASAGDLCKLFALSGNGDGLLLPNSGNNPLSGDALEEIQLIRDEEANTVWAIEKRYYDTAADQIISRGGSADIEENIAIDAPQDEDGQMLEAYRLRTDIARNWIPYIPIRYSDGANEQVYFRRARLSDTQIDYKTVLIGESWRLREEEAPRYGVRLQRLNRAASGGSKVVFWTARTKDLGFKHPASGLEFDRVD